MTYAEVCRSRCELCAKGMPRVEFGAAFMHRRSEWRGDSMGGSVQFLPPVICTAPSPLAYIAELTARLEAAEADTARLDWLDAQLPMAFRWYLAPHDGGQWHIAMCRADALKGWQKDGSLEHTQYLTQRAAIDAARKGGGA